MKARELKKHLETIPDDADVTYRLNFDRCSKCDAIKDLKDISLVFTLGSNLMQIYVKEEYPGLPK